MTLTIRNLIGILLLSFLINAPALGQERADEFSMLKSFTLSQPEEAEPFYVIPLDSLPQQWSYVEMISEKSYFIFNQNIIVDQALKKAVFYRFKIFSSEKLQDIRLLASQKNQEIILKVYDKTKVMNANVPVVKNQFRSTKPAFKNALLIVSLLILTLVSILRIKYAKRFKEVYNLRNIFSVRPVEGDSARLRLFEQGGIFSAIVYTLITALIVGLSHDQNNTLQISFLFLGYLKAVALIATLILLKAFLVSLMSRIYGIAKINAFYIKEMIGISLLFITFIFVVVVISFLMNDAITAFWLLTVKYLVVGLYVLRAVLLYFKILRLSGFTYLYLFSYFCTTEILPLIMGLKYFF